MTMRQVRKEVCPAALVTEGGGRKTVPLFVLYCEVHVDRDPLFFQLFTLLLYFDFHSDVITNSENILSNI